MKCQRPSFVPDKSKPKNLRMEHHHVLVPCGYCPNCLAARASAWSFRLMQEEKVSSSAYFITLTYDTDHVPITRNGYLSIKKKDIQDYMKRVRRSHEYAGHGEKLKYYAVGEYGGKLKRPHYHILLFNADLKLMLNKEQYLILSLFGYDGKTCVMSKDWTQGHITVGQVTGASVGYTLKYISKPEGNFRENDDRERPFSLMSKFLGVSYLANEKMIKWHKADLQNRMYVNLPGGQKCTMPRYYKDKMYSENERKRITSYNVDKFTAEIYRELITLSDEKYAKAQFNKTVARIEAIKKIQKVKNSDYAKSQKSKLCHS